MSATPAPASPAPIPAPASVAPARRGRPASPAPSTARPAARARQSVEVAADPDALLCLPTVCELAGFKRSSIYNMLRDGEFPQPVRLGASVRWRAGEVRKWLRGEWRP